MSLFYHFNVGKSLLKLPLMYNMGKFDIVMRYDLICLCDTNSQKPMFHLSFWMKY